MWAWKPGGAGTLRAPAPEECGIKRFSEVRRVTTRRRFRKPFLPAPSGGRRRPPARAPARQKSVAVPKNPMKKPLRPRSGRRGLFHRDFVGAGADFGSSTRSVTLYKPETRRARGARSARRARTSARRLRRRATVSVRAARIARARRTVDLCQSGRAEARERLIIPPADFQHALQLVARAVRA